MNDHRRKRTASILGALAAVALAAGCAGSERPGHPDTYERIEALTDCAALQEAFDTAADNHDRDDARGRLDLMKIDSSYMDAADDRMGDVGCYDQ